MFDEPKTMYDALAAILGLEDIELLAKTLRDARLERERALKTLRAEVKAHRKSLEGLDDERAAAAAKALAGRTPELDTVELALAGTVDSGDPDGDLAGLRALATLAVPDPQTAGAVLDALEEAEYALAELAGSDAARAAGLAGLLEAALRHDSQHPGRLPGMRHRRGNRRRLA